MGSNQAGGGALPSRWWLDEQDLQVAIEESLEAGESKMTTTKIVCTQACGCSIVIDNRHVISSMLVKYGSIASVRRYLESGVCNECARKALESPSSGFSDEEKEFLDRAYEKAKVLGRPFTASEVVQEAWDAGLDLDIAHDLRFQHYGGTTGHDRLYVLSDK